MDHLSNTSRAETAVSEAEASASAEKSGATVETAAESESAERIAARQGGFVAESEHMVGDGVCAHGHVPIARLMRHVSDNTNLHDSASISIFIIQKNIII